MKNKLLLSILLFIPFLANCGSSDTSIVKSSDLRGTFSNETNTVAKSFRKQTEDNSDYLFATLYPYFLLEDNTTFYYSSQQKLSLRKDFTFRYQYSISLKNARYNDICKLEVDISGVFDYETLDEDDKIYYVALSNPTSGKESIYSPNVVGNTNANYWSIHTEVDYVLNIEENINNPYFSYDKYIRTRKVIVKKALTEEDSNIVEDGLFNNFIIDDLCKYGTEASTR